jgi:putative hydrolase of the HAD superfamily
MCLFLSKIIFMKKIKVVAFDADDTLWVNEPYFRETEIKFCQLLEAFLPASEVEKQLLKIEIQNLPMYGYGIKGFMLSMVETALKVSNHQISIKTIEQILEYGKEMLEKPIDLLDGVNDVLKNLKKEYRLVVATKGDLLDQERKLQKSGLASYFHHIEIMSEKREADYSKLIKHLDIAPDAFLMVGNSLKSDILPVLNIGGHAIHIPFHTTWILEKVDVQITNPNFKHVDTIRQILPYLI